MKTHGIAADIIVLAGRKSVPKTTSGKIQRQLCKKRYLEGSLNVLHIDNATQLEKPISAQLSTVNFDPKTSDPAVLLNPIFNHSVYKLDGKKKLSELGLTSMKLGELQYALSLITQKSVPLEYLLMDPCLKEIMSLLDGKVDLRQLTNIQIDLAHEFEKYQDIETDLANYDHPVPHQVLLTGSTGFLGAYLLNELLENTEWHITCFVQADSVNAGINRVVTNMEEYKLWQPNYLERIKVVIGNLEKTRLGLTKKDWEYLADNIDLIFHSAALLNFIYPYQKLMASNVLGTKQLIELAGHKRVKALHYISTVGYFMSADLKDDAVVSEQTELGVDDGIYGGYNQTKWLAEKLVIDARKHHIPTVVYRPSLITGESQFGRWNKADVVCRMLKGCIQLGARPILNAKLNFVPVDYVAKAIACFAKEKPYFADTYHLTNPDDVDVDQLFEYVKVKGFNVEAIDYEAWKEMLKNNKEQNQDSSFSPLKPFFMEKVSSKNVSLFDLYLHNNSAKIDGTFTQKRLASRDIHCDKVDQKLLDKYLNYLIDCGYLAR